MKRANWPVGAYGIRPAGKPTECFYCHEPKGGTHKPDCVIRQRTVVVEVRLELVLSEPEGWSQEDIESHFNASSSCQSNIAGYIEQLRDRIGCLCGLADVSFLREATADDEKRQLLFVERIPS